MRARPETTPQQGHGIGVFDILLVPLLVPSHIILVDGVPSYLLRHFFRCYLFFSRRRWRLRWSWSGSFRFRFPFCFRIILSFMQRARSWKLNGGHNAERKMDFTPSERGAKGTRIFFFSFFIPHRLFRPKGREGATHGWWSGYRREASGKMGVRAYRKGNTYIFLRFRRLISVSF